MILLFYMENEFVDRELIRPSVEVEKKLLPFKIFRRTFICISVISVIICGFFFFTETTLNSKGKRVYNTNFFIAIPCIIIGNIMIDRLVLWIGKQYYVNVKKKYLRNITQSTIETT